MKGMEDATRSRIRQLMELRSASDQLQLATGAFGRPAAEWRDLGDRLQLLVDLPGVTPEALQLQSDEHEVEITARREGASHGERPSEFWRRLPFPEAVAFAMGEARLQSGVLEVTWPKLSSLEKGEL